jgi:hypothetical protein
MHSKLWVVDSGASAHFFVDREDFITLGLLDSGTVSRISVRVRGHGTCKLTLDDPAGRRCTVTLGGIVYAPDLALRSNSIYLRILSVQVVTKRRFRLEFTQSCDKLWTPEECVFDMVKLKYLVW